MALANNNEWERVEPEWERVEPPKVAAPEEPVWERVSDPISDIKNTAGGFIGNMGSGLLESVANVGEEAGAISELGHQMLEPVIPKTVSKDWEDTNNKIREMTGGIRDVAKTTKEYWVSPEDEKNFSFPQKVISGAGSLVPYLAQGPAGLFTMANDAMMGTGKAVIDSGGTSTDAGLSGFVAGGLQATLGVINPIFKDTGKTVVVGMIWNPVQGAFSDKLVSSINEGNEEIEKRFDWKDMEKRTIEGIYGAAFGYKDAKQFQGLEKKIAKERDSIMKDLDTVLTSQFSDAFSNYRPYAIPAGSNPKAELDKLIAVTQDPNFNKDPSRSHHLVNDMLSVYSKIEDLDPVERALARIYAIKGEQLDLENILVRVRNTLDPTNGEFIRRPNDQDALIVRGDPTNLEPRVFMHEVTHAFTGHIIDNNSHLKADIDNIRKTAFEHFKTTAKGKEILDLLDQVVFYDTRDGKNILTGKEDYSNPDNPLESYFNKPGYYGIRALDPSADILKIKADLQENRKFIYGFTNAHEFVTEVMTRKDFRDSIAQAPYSRDKAGTIPVERKHINWWNPVFRAMGFSRDTKNYATETIKTVIHSLETSKLRKLSDESRDFALRRAEKIGNLSKDVDLNPWLQHIWGRLKEVGNTTTSAEEFKVNASEILNSGTWKDIVDKYGDTIYDNISMVDATVDYKKIKQFITNNKEITTYMPFGVSDMLDIFYKDVVDGARVIPNHQDISPALTNLFGGQQLASLLKNNTFGPMIRFVISKGNEYKALNNQLQATAHSFMVDYFGMKPEDQLALMEKSAYWDSIAGRNILKGQKLQWPDKQMLMTGKSKMSDKEADVYLQNARAMDYIYGIMDHNQARHGLPPVDRVPGYIPHFHDGPYKVFVELVSDDPAKYGNKVVHVKTFWTEYGASSFAKRVQKGVFNNVSGHAGMKFVPQYFTDNGKYYKVAQNKEQTSSILVSMKEHTDAERAIALDTFASDMMKVIEDMDTSSIEGTLKHARERSNVGGFTNNLYPVAKGFGAGGKHIDPNLFNSRFDDFVRRHSSKSLRIYERMIRNTTNVYTTSKFLDDVITPLISGTDGRGSMFKNTPNMYNWLLKYAYNYSGHNVNQAKWLDDALSGAAIKMGLGPDTFRELQRGTRNILSQVKIRVDPKNYLANLSQVAHVNWVMSLDNAERKIAGKPTVNIGKVLVDTLQDLKKGNNSDLNKALELAYANHILKPQLDAEIRSQESTPTTTAIHNATLGPVNPAVEGWMRKQSFSVLFNYYNSVHKNTMRAFAEAENSMRKIAIDYDAQNRPFMFQNYGILGESISPFAVFRNGYIGNMAELFKFAYKNKGNPNAYRPLGAMMVTFLATAGIYGMPLIALWEAVADALLAFDSDWDIPKPRTLLSRFRKSEMGDSIIQSTGETAVDILEHGLLSLATKPIVGGKGTDFSGAAGAVGPTDLGFAAMVPFVSAGVDLVKLGNKGLASKILDTPAPSMEDLYGPVKALAPGIMGEAIDSHFQEEGNTTRYTGSKLQGMYNRTPEDMRSINMLGGRSVEETAAREVEADIIKSEKFRKKQTDALMSRAADIMQGIANDRSATIQSLLAKAVSQYGMSPDEFNSGVARMLDNRRFDAVTKRAMRDSVSRDRQENRYNSLTGE